MTQIDRSKFADREAPKPKEEPAVQDRALREAETRETEARVPSWKPPAILPSPVPQPGWTYRYIRIASRGSGDTTSVNYRFREGWVPVKKTDHPEITIMTDRNAFFQDGIEIGGLLLCKIPTETIVQRQRYYGEMAMRQLEAVNNAYFKENNASMPKQVFENRTVVKTGTNARDT